jgi:hypothetical protein
MPGQISEESMSRIAVRITFHGLTVKDVLDSDIRRRAERLRAFHPEISSCDVVVEVPHRHQHHGRHVRVRLNLTIANGDAIVVSHEPSLHADQRVAGAASTAKGDEADLDHRHARAAIRDAFAAARRRLQDDARIQRGAVKLHASRVSAIEQET